MKTYFDTSTLIGVVLKSHPHHPACMAAFTGEAERITCGHALAETFSALTGFYKIPNAAAAELTLGLSDIIDIEALQLLDYQICIGETKQRGIMGGGVYDSLHATFARRRGAGKIITLNLGDFRHVASDLEVVSP